MSVVLAQQEWVVNHAPAAGSQATASKAAGAAGVKHVAKAIYFGFSASVALGAPATFQINLRDGASGAGTVLMSWQFTLPAATAVPVWEEIEGIDLAGSAATAMTLEFSGGVGNLLEYVILVGYDS